MAFRQVPNSTIYYTPEEELDFEKILNTPLPKVPLKPSFSAHWLAIEGVQPKIPENPITHDKTLIDLKAPAGKKDFATAPIIPEDSEIKGPLRHVLSKEIQLYYEKVINAISSGSEEEKSVAFECVRKDAGLQQLIPYFIAYCSEMIAKNLRNLPLLRNMVNIIACLLENDHLFIEPYLHQFMPTLMTCIVGKRLSENPMEDHWSLRIESSRIVANICNTYGHSYNTLQPRVTKTALRAWLDFNKPLTTHFGAIVTMTLLGKNTIETLIVPNLSVYLPFLREKKNSSMDEVAQLEIEKVEVSLINAGKIYRDGNSEADMSAFIEYFGANKF